LKTFAELIRENWETLARGKKPYVVGEFGFVSTAQMADAMKTIMDTGMAGGLLWSLRFRDRDGGFYWHSEPSGGNKYKAFHWPGSTAGAAYDEINLMALVRSNAFAIRGLTPPPIPVPAPPKLLPITDAAAISWQGSVGAAKLHRRTRTGKRWAWTVAGKGIDESFVQYRPLFCDESAPKGIGIIVSARSTNPACPNLRMSSVRCSHAATFVDELADFSKVSARRANGDQNARQPQGEGRRAARGGKCRRRADLSASDGHQGLSRVRVFSQNDVADPKFAISADGRNYHDVKAGRRNELFSRPRRLQLLEAGALPRRNIGRRRKVPENRADRRNPDWAGGNHSRV
jgi:hypothetical protein